MFLKQEFHRNVTLEIIIFMHMIYKIKNVLNQLYESIKSPSKMLWSSFPLKIIVSNYESLVSPDTVLQRKLILSFASSYQLEIAAGLETGRAFSSSISSMTSCVEDQEGSVYAAALSVHSYVHWA
jgi:hypothetical protein